MGTANQPRRHSGGLPRCVATARVRPEDRARQGPAARHRTVSFLLDTNVVSEWTRPRPDIGVVEFLATEDEDALFLSIVTLAELRRGVDRLATGRRRTRLDDWLRNDLPTRFTGRLVGI